MPTYASTNGKKDFDWNAYLDACILLEVPATHDMVIKSQSWVTCACGNQCAALPRVDGKPKDRKLAKLGMDFMRYMQLSEMKPTEAHSHLVNAKNTLHEIELRAELLLRKIKHDELTKRVKQLQSELAVAERELDEFNIPTH